MLFLLLATPALALTAETLLKIAPDAADCTGKSSECRTADAVAPLLTASFEKYQITSSNAQAAIVALCALESVQFAWKRNQSPGRPGQGTVNMQMKDFNQQYLKAIGNDTTVDLNSNSSLNAMMDIVTEDEYNFGSAAWFYSTQCSAEVKNLIDSDADRDTGFDKYMTDCVQTEQSPDRLAYWTTAKAAFADVQEAPTEETKWWV
jgi:hypothetical protein